MAFLHSEHNSKINLSAKEMLEISQEISRDFTPCFFSRMPEPVEKIKLSPRELLDIGEEIARDFAPKLLLNTPELMLLPVDPEHIYVYWNFGKNRETAKPDNDGKEQLTLRIYSQPDQQKTDTETTHWFDVALDSPKTQQQVSLPNLVDETIFSAAIGRSCANDNFIAIAHSNLIHAPRGRPARHRNPENFTTSPSKNDSGQGINQ